MVLKTADRLDMTEFPIPAYELAEVKRYFDFEAHGVELIPLPVMAVNLTGADGKPFVIYKNPLRLSFNLLRFINSAGFGARTEVIRLPRGFDDDGVVAAGEMAVFDFHIAAMVGVNAVIVGHVEARANIADIEEGMHDG